MTDEKETKQPENPAGKPNVEKGPPVPDDANAVERDGKIKVEAAKTAKAEKIEKDERYVDGKRMMTLEVGHYGNEIRVPGVIFTFSGIPGSWMREATKDECKKYDKYLASLTE